MLFTNIMGLYSSKCCLSQGGMHKIGRLYPCFFALVFEVHAVDVKCENTENLRYQFLLACMEISKELFPKQN